MKRRDANLVAAVVAVIALLATLALVGVGNDLKAPESTTTLTKKAVPRSAATKTITSARDKKSVVKVTHPRKPSETTTTNVKGERSFLERTLGDNGLVVLQIGAALLAAFVAGAVTQRVALGEYGFKLGPVELSTLADVSNEALGKVTTAVDTLEKQLKALDTSSHEADATLTRNLADVARRLDRLSKPQQPT